MYDIEKSRTFISIKYSCYCNLDDTNLDTLSTGYQTYHMSQCSAVDRLWADWIMPKRTRTT